MGAWLFFIDSTQPTTYYLILYALETIISAFYTMV
jgi:hypothetical protein